MDVRRLCPLAALQECRGPPRPAEGLRRRAITEHIVRKTGSVSIDLGIDAALGHRAALALHTCPADLCPIKRAEGDAA